MAAKLQARHATGHDQTDRQGQENIARHPADFKFDKQIFTEDIDYKFDTLVQRFREMAFVAQGVWIRFVDERNDREMTFYFEGGLTSFVRYLNRNRENLHSVVHVEKDIDAIGIEAAIQ